jgi:hypothetical protein
MLVEAGEREKNITPSTRLAPYLTRRMGKLWWQFARFHPGQGPVPTFPAWVQSFRNKLGRVALVTLIALAILAFVGPSGVWMIPLAMIIVMGLTVYLVERSTMFWQFKDPTIQTFRDLAYALAEQQPRRQRLSNAPQVSRGGSEPGTQA